MNVIPPRLFDLSSLGPERRHLRGPGWAERLTVDGTAITLTYTPERTRVLRWDDPELGFEMVDYRNPVARNVHLGVPGQAYQTPFIFWPYSSTHLKSGPDWVWLPTEAAEAIVEAAGLQKLVIHELPPPSAALDDLQRAVFRRRPLQHPLLEKLGIYLPPPDEDP